VSFHNIILDLYKNYPICKGDIKQEVYDYLVSNIMKIYADDILEIGAYDGRSTKVFAEIAKKYNKIVHVIDPWDGHQEGNEQIYKIFSHNIKGFDNIKILRKSSKSLESINYISNLSLVFCLIDGLHTKEAVTSDILAVQNAKWLGGGIILVDDVRNLYGCMSQNICDDIMLSVENNQNKIWKHFLSPKEWLGTCYLKES
jgi:predicted O-methyltransferase YrrM